MKLLKLTALTAAVAAMTACSSSGGGANIATPKPVVAATTTPTTTTPTPAATSVGIQGNVINLNQNKVAVGNITNTAATAQVNKVVVNGQTLDFIPTGFAVAKLTLTAGNMDRIGGSSQLAYTRYGYIREGSATPALFAQGDITPANAVPQTGAATYNGSAAHVASGKVSLVDSSFTVDFGKQQLQGAIKAPEGDVNLAATINGNAFSGTQNGIQTKGMFYGSQAQELGGVYTNTSGTISGAYGAKK